MSFIEVQNVTHIYPGSLENDVSDKAADNYALRNVSLRIEEGELVAIVGANGSGKSTLAKHLNALILPTEGKVLVGGEDTAGTADLYSIRQRVSMVFQNPDNQLIAAVVADDVAFGPENIGVESAEIRRRVKEALAAVGMSEYADYPPHMLSGGQKQRVAIAGTLAMQTSCIIFDEATAMLDPRGRAEVMDAILELRRKTGMTIVIITHFMDEAIKAERIIVMNKGEIVATGSPGEIFSTPSLIRDAGLELPLATEVAEHLREKGLSLPTDIIEDTELIEALAENKRKNKAKNRYRICQ